PSGPLVALGLGPRRGVEPALEQVARSGQDGPEHRSQEAPPRGAHERNSTTNRASCHHRGESTNGPESSPRLTVAAAYEKVRTVIMGQEPFQPKARGLHW